MNSDMNNDDLSQRYERFYKDDSFREAYYNYHKQHHQQEQQQQPTSYDNDYSYDSDYEPEYSSYKLDYKPEYNSYGKDNNHYKSKDSSSNVKCNNINVNVNGDIDIGASQALGDLATEAQASADEGEVGASSFESGGRTSGHDSDSRFVCINNNNNNVGGETPGTTYTIRNTNCL